MATLLQLQKQYDDAENEAYRIQELVEGLEESVDSFKDVVKRMKDGNDKDVAINTLSFMKDKLREARKDMTSANKLVEKAEKEYQKVKKEECSHKNLKCADCGKHVVTIKN